MGYTFCAPACHVGNKNAVWNKAIGLCEVHQARAISSRAIIVRALSFGVVGYQAMMTSAIGAWVRSKLQMQRLHVTWHEHCRRDKAYPICARSVPAFW